MLDACTIRVETLAKGHDERARTAPKPWLFPFPSETAKRCRTDTLSAVLLLRV